ncbi:MAG: hypothetical protein PHF86_13715 [Candidatus Nanoarchaeia archaeon]|nr:hypothetical protein [Candidatus Nanoarchaeia archaeon]
MVKCSKCGKNIETTFLEKFQGTFIGKYKKKKAICSNCQKE